MLLETTSEPIFLLGPPGSGYSTVMDRANFLVQRVEEFAALPAEAAVVLMHCLSARWYGDVLEALSGGAVTAEDLAGLPIGAGIWIGPSRFR